MLTARYVATGGIVNELDRYVFPKARHCLMNDICLSGMIVCECSDFTSKILGRPALTTLRQYT